MTGLANTEGARVRRGGNFPGFCKSIKNTGGEPPWNDVDVLRLRCGAWLQHSGADGYWRSMCRQFLKCVTSEVCAITELTSGDSVAGQCRPNRSSLHCAVTYNIPKPRRDLWPTSRPRGPFSEPQKQLAV